MIARGASPGRTAYRLRLRGLGQDPYQQWVASLPASCWQNNDPSSGTIICPTPASVTAAEAALPSHQVSPLDFVSSSVVQTANNPTVITANISDAPGLTAQLPNLSGRLAQQVTYILAAPALAGDPTQNLMQVAQQFCQLYVNAPGGGDTQCSQMDSLVAQFAAEAKQSIAAHASATGGVTTSPSGSSSMPPSPGPGYIWDGTAWRAPATTATNGSQSSTGSPVVVNPSPASQAITDGSSLTSPGSVTSVANGTSVQTGATPTTSVDLIPGIPNAALFVGGGALALILLMMASRGK